MAASLTVTPDALSDRALLLLLLERTDKIMADLTALQTQLTALQTGVTALKGVADAGAALSTQAIAELEALAKQVATLQPGDQAAIDALTAQVQQTVSDLGAANTELQASNASVQDELTKLTPPATPAPAPSAA